MTKDADFVASHVLHGTPSRSLLVATGNLSNRDLEALLVPRFEDVVSALEAARFVEVSRDRLIVHAV